MESEDHIVEHNVSSYSYGSSLEATNSATSSTNKKIHRKDGNNHFQCSICDKTFLKKIYLKWHYSTHNLGEKPIQCVECGITFARPSTLKKHTRNVHKKGDCFTCQVCKRTFSQEIGLKKHMKTHAEDNPYRCHLCNRGFLGPKFLQMHMELHEACKHVCPHCKLNVTSKEELKKHKCPFATLANQKSRNDDGTKPKKKSNRPAKVKFECKECSEDFNSLELLAKHEPTHEGEKNQMCDHCGHCFITMNHLNRHVEKHHLETIVKNKRFHIDADEGLILDPYGHLRTIPVDKLTKGEDKSLVAMFVCAVCATCFIKEEHLRKHVKLKKHTLENLKEDDED